MDNLPKSLILLVLAAIILSFLAIYLVLKPYVYESFNLATPESANIGVTISGITAPILTILSVALLYLALRKQTESNENQRLKNDADLVFLLYNQLEAEYRETSTRQYKQHKFNSRDNDSSAEIFYGFDAFIKICNIFNDTSAERFASTNEASKILFIIQSYNVLDELISISQIENNLKHIIKRKVNYFYISRMRDPLATFPFISEIILIQNLSR